MLDRNYECEFEPETLAAVREVCGEQSEEYECARRYDAKGLMVRLRRSSWPVGFHIEPRQAEAIAKDPSILASMIEHAKAVAKLAEAVDQEWLRKCPLQAVLRETIKQRTENKGLWIAS